jgi:hypothetical protein
LLGDLSEPSLAPEKVEPVAPGCSNSAPESPAGLAVASP